MGFGKFGEELFFKGVVDAFPEGGAAGGYGRDSGCIELAFWGRALISFDRLRKWDYWFFSWLFFVSLFLWISRGGSC